MVGVFSPESVCSFNEIGRRVTLKRENGCVEEAGGIESKRRRKSVNEGQSEFKCPQSLRECSRLLSGKGLFRSLPDTSLGHMFCVKFASTSH